MKAHFIAAYDAHLESGPTANTTGYHGAAAALSNDDSLSSITNSIAQMNMDNNTNMRAMNESMSIANTELRQALVATKHQVAATAPSVAVSALPAEANQYYAATAAGSTS